MKKIFIACVALLGFIFCTPALAVENGAVAISNGIVVHILSKIGADGSFGTCSGALISPDVVATAAHCVTDENGQGATDIRVSPPGATGLYDANSWTTAYKTFFSFDYQGLSANGKVNSSDIAFLLINKRFDQTDSIYFPSEAQLLNLKSSQSKLRVIGYGYTSDTQPSSYDFGTPYYFDGQYSQRLTADPTAGLVESPNSDTCGGDSGAPVLNITPSKIMIIGIITGGDRGKNCSKKDTSGVYYSQFTIINHFSNLALAAQVEATALQYKVATKLDSLYQDKNTESNGLNAQLASLQATLASLKEQLSAYQSSGLKVLTCVSGAKTKSVVASKPKCPSGYTSK
jgi:secreted trypsin-like serine protease